MWSALAITEKLYGFQSEQGYLEPWVAIAQIVGRSENERHMEVECLELSARVFLPELENAEQYEQLLDAIRQFTCRKTAESGCKACTIYYSCKGIMEEDINLPLQGVPYNNGRIAIEAAFVEQYEVDTDWQSSTRQEGANR